MQKTNIPTLAPNDIHVWELISVSASQGQSDLDIDVLRPDELTRANRFVRHRDRNRSLAGRVMLRKLLSLYTGLPASSLIFATQAFGKPFIAGPPAGASISFNVSYSNDSIVCVVGRYAKIGIDIEDSAPDLDFTSIARQFFSPEEQSWINDHARNDRKQAFYAIWTLKEAYVKATGKGLSRPLDAYTLIPRADGVHFRDVPTEIDSSRKWSFFHRRTGYGCALSLACKHPVDALPQISWYTYEPESGTASGAGAHFAQQN